MKEYFDGILKTVKDSVDSLDYGRFEALAKECVNAINCGKKVVVSGLGKNVPVCDKFVGTIDIVDIIRGKQTESVETIIRHNTPYIYAHELISESLEKLREYNLDITPVLDHGDHLLGVITSDDLVNIVDEELGEGNNGKENK